MAFKDVKNEVNKRLKNKSVCGLASVSTTEKETLFQEEK
ncbi:MAG: hypothetical protein ACI97K_000039 [Glaciecola sp.]